MKQISRHLERDRSGAIQLLPEEDEDMWHVYNLLAKGDQIRATTIRRVQTQSNTGSVDSQRIRMTLSIKVESVDYDVQASTLRINGQVSAESQHVKMGAYHTIDLELHRNFTVYKHEWDSIDLDRIDQACDVTQRAEIAAIVMQEGIANVCLITENMTILRQRVESPIPRKRKGSTTQHDKAVLRFFESIMQALLRHFNFAVVKSVVIASPGFLKDDFYKYLFAEAVRSDNKVLMENKPKFVAVHSSSGHKQALQEVLADPAVQSRLSDTKYAKEVRALDEFFSMLNNDPDRAYYGWDHVRKANEIGAVGTLLLTDSLFRSADIPTRKKYIALVDAVKASGGQVYIFSSLHVSGEQLNQLTGVAAILNFPAPHIEDELEQEQLEMSEPSPANASMPT